MKFKFLILLFLPFLSYGQNKKQSFFMTKASVDANYSQEGQDFLIANARTFHDFTQLSGSHNSAITTSQDLTANNRDLLNNTGGYSTTPKVFDFRYPDLSRKNLLNVKSGGSMMFLNNTTNAIFSTSHEIHITLQYRGTGFVGYLFGVNSTQVLYGQIDTDGKVSLFIRRTGTTSRIRTVNPVFGASIQNTDIGGLVYLRFRLDFGANQVKIYSNGVELPTELVSGTNPSTWTSYTWNNIYSFAIGAFAEAFQSVGTLKDMWFSRFAVTNLLSQDEANMVALSMLNGTGSGNLRLIRQTLIPFCTQSKSYQIGVYLASPQNITIPLTAPANTSINVSELVFNTENYNVPQLIRITATDRRGFDPLTLTIGSAEIPFVITETYTGGVSPDVGTDYQLTDGYCAMLTEMDGLNTISDVNALRTTIQNFIFKGSYPTGGPNSTVPTTNYNSVTLGSHPIKNIHIFLENDLNGYEWESQVCHIRQASPNGKLFIDFFGHGPETGHQELYNAVMAAGGYDYAMISMPNTWGNSTDNPVVNGHQMFGAGLDTDTYSGKRLFHFEKIRFLSWIVTQYSYTEIHIAGLSGGAQSLSMTLPLLTDTNVISKLGKMFVCRGVCASRHVGGGGDYEAGPNFETEFTGGATATDGPSGPRVSQFYRENQSLKIILSNCVGRGQYHLMGHELDANGGKRYPEAYKAIMQTKASALGGAFYHFVSDAAGEGTHGYLTGDINYIINNL
jgi:hypothetical protein